MRIRRHAIRLLAVAALVLGIVLMHHVARSGHEAAASEQPSAGMSTSMSMSMSMSMSPQADPGCDCPPGAGDHDQPSGHGLLHLCLAVLTAAAAALAGWLLLATRPIAVLPREWRPGAWRRAERGPPRPHGSALLVSLCVMRT
ncbi:DUF6153 family protein [Jiangella anatolica]|uniref:Uncharacterized protein n=1 Tax=Jiangella anatolica TaxID=2670374 RepID=A0A2W2CE29_9ACTN|nr:DUF6153 family protein [Jiangella anatolica]PZF83906.1 hypothetical protein C1I92_10600 [Jiangella anatolica]